MKRVYKVLLCIAIGYLTALAAVTTALALIKVSINVTLPN
jgi:hypothetical protein